MTNSHWAIVVFGMALGVGAWGQPLRSQPTDNDTSQGTGELNPGRWFQLALPSIGIPVKATWITSPAPTFEMERLATYRWELGTTFRSPLSLHAFNQVQPAIELNCMASVCAPKIERVLGFEGRIHLGGRGALPNNYFFVKHDFVREPVGFTRRIRVGFGGDLDL